MKRIVIILSLCMSFITLNAQSFNQDRTALANFLSRMYKSSPFEGVKVVQDYDNTYLLSVVLVNKSSSESATNRLAMVKSNRQVMQYLGGLTIISSETIIRTVENPNVKESVAEITDIIKENSIGHTQSMEVLTVIELDSGQKCYMFIRNIKDLK